jgi:GPH family glycoside/pentoside/hexuronide:cation symporter
MNDIYFGTSLVILLSEIRKQEDEKMFQKFTNENASPKVTFGERVAYGFGDFSSNILYSAMGVYLMLYYTDVVGVNAIAVGLIMTASKVFDGVSDLIMGVIIDRTHGTEKPGSGF